MNIFKKSKLIERKAKIGSYLMYGGAALMLIILVFSFSYPQETTILSIAALIGFFLSQYGIILKNRWGKRPRIDEVIDQSLKGLNAKYTIFHYELGANHVLISPSGVFPLIPAVHDGKIIYEDDKWWQIRKKRGGESKKRQNKLKTDAELEMSALQRSLHRKIPELGAIEIKPIVVFLHPDAQVKAEDAPIFASHVKKLKPFLRKLTKAPTLDEGQIQILAESSGF